MSPTTPESLNGTTSSVQGLSPISIANVGDVYETSDQEGDAINDEYVNDNNIDDDDDDQVLLPTGDGIFNTNNNETDECHRVGTISSARFNILSTMVGGGCLSLPLAFQKSGNGLMGPLLLLLTAAITEFVFRIHIQSARLLHAGTNTNNRQARRGTDSFENVAETAFGSTMRTFCTALVLFMCFFGTVGYAVLLRDMLRPINNTFFTKHHHNDTDLSIDTATTLTWRDNISMWIVILGITPACTIRTLTSLQRFGALGMCSVLILGCCIFFRSGQCLLHSNHSLVSNFQLFPNQWHDVLDVIPLYISCYVCHYNILPVHNELRNPTKQRVRYWLQSTVWLSTLFYCCMGIAGSVYGSCSKNGDNTIPVHGNILLDFPEKDPLLMIGRMCLAITITLAFPMLTIPARDIVLRTIVPKLHDLFGVRKRQQRRVLATTANETLTEALLEDYNNNNTPPERNADTSTTDVAMDSIEQQVPSTSDENQAIATSSSFVRRLSAAVFMLYSATILASCVTSIDIVWDLLGSSLSILLSYLIPCGSYILICRQQQSRTSTSIRQRISILLAGVLAVIYTPLMFISTANAIYNIFILHKK